MGPLGLVIVTEHSTEHTAEPSSRNRCTRDTRMFLNGRERRESIQSPIVVIVQPDLRREVWLDKSSLTFTVRPIVDLMTPEEQQQWSKRGAGSPSKHVFHDPERITYDVFIQTEKLTETAQFFGFPARRYVTYSKDVYPEGMHKERESISDGWYLDLCHPAMPKPSRLYRTAVVSMGNERPVIHRSGEPNFPGLPAKVVTTGRQTYFTSDGKREHSLKHTVEIVSLNECLLDSYLFEVPEGFRERPVFPSRWSKWAKQFQKALHRMCAA